MTQKESKLIQSGFHYMNKAEECIASALICMLRRKGFSDDEIYHFSVTFATDTETVVHYNQEPIWDGGLEEIDGKGKAEIYDDLNYYHSYIKR